MGDHSDSAPMSMMETDLLIVGTGPAGGSLACFLASHGEGWHLVVAHWEADCFQV